MLHYDLGIDALGLGQPSPTLDACSTKTEILAKTPLLRGAGSAGNGFRGRRQTRLRVARHGGRSSAGHRVQLLSVEGDATTSTTATILRPIAKVGTARSPRLIAW